LFHSPIGTRSEFPHPESDTGAAPTTCHHPLSSYLLPIGIDVWSQSSQLDIECPKNAKSPDELTEAKTTTGSSQSTWSQNIIELLSDKVQVWKTKRYQSKSAEPAGSMTRSSCVRISAAEAVRSTVAKRIVCP